MYAKVGEPLHGDPYALDGIHHDHRKLIKITLMKMINAKKPRIARPRGMPLPPGVAWRDLQEAIAQKHAAIATYFRSGEGLRLLGRARYELKEIPEAIDAYQQAIALDERDVWAMNNLGLIYIQQDRSDIALPILARAVELRSNSPVFQNNLGTALERTGHFAAAGKAYEAVLAADSTYGKAGVSLERVRGLIDTSVVNTVDLTELAEAFRLQIRMWGETARQPAAPDSLPEVVPAAPEVVPGVPAPE